MADVPSVEERYLRAEGLPVELESRQDRVGRRVTVPAGCPGREQQGCHEGLDTGQLGVAPLGRYDCLLRGLAKKGVRVEGNPSNTGGVLVARYLAEVLVVVVIDLAPFGVAVGSLDAAPQLVKGALQAAHLALLGKVNGKHEHLGVATRHEVLRSRRNVYL